MPGPASLQMELGKITSSNFKVERSCLRSCATSFTQQVFTLELIPWRIETEINSEMLIVYNSLISRVGIKNSSLRTFPFEQDKAKHK